MIPFTVTSTAYLSDYLSTHTRTYTEILQVSRQMTLLVFARPTMFITLRQSEPEGEQRPNELRPLCADGQTYTNA